MSSVSRKAAASGTNTGKRAISPLFLKDIISDNGLFIGGHCLIVLADPQIDMSRHMNYVSGVGHERGKAVCGRQRPFRRQRRL